MSSLTCSPYLTRSAMCADEMMAAFNRWQLIWVRKSRALAAIENDPFAEITGAWSQRHLIATEAEAAANEIIRMGGKPVPAFGERAEELLAAAEASAS